MLEPLSQIATIVGAIAGMIALGCVGTVMVKKSRRQRQVVRGGAVGIQSGRDTILDIGYDKAKPRGRN
jgi:hypothetical protein